jgi:type I restriction enzyme R subunit
MKQADATRTAHAEALQRLLDFKSGLTRFGSLYTYIAQTIDLGDPGLEAFASFARLLFKRLNGVPPEQVDVSALVLTGFDIKPEDMPGGEEPPKEEAVILKPVGPGGGGQAGLPVYLRQVIARLNSIFGEATPLTDKVALVNHLADIVREDANTVAQIKNNPRDVAMNGNIKGTVQSALVRALGSHTDLVTQVLKNDKQALNPLVGLLYEMVKAGQNIDRSEFGA